LIKTLGRIYERQEWVPKNDKRKPTLGDYEKKRLREFVQDYFNVSNNRGNFPE
jgi:hypothetical protein